MIEDARSYYFNSKLTCFVFYNIGGQEEKLEKTLSSEEEQDETNDRRITTNSLVTTFRQSK